ncbi:hypothetical protein BA895_21770 [Humibacillus sp. DSM 29435]|nr:hypothetical protein BA895_21770 [Humibacillus sp. DSM 29435]
MSTRHQILAHILTGPEQVPRRLRVRGRDRYDLTQVRQPGQVASTPGIGLDPASAGTLQLRRGRNQTLETLNRQEPGQPEPRQPSLIGDRDQASNLTSHASSPA